jgi:hypothetical protein
MFDIAISVVIAALAAAMGYMGVHIALRPPTDRMISRYRLGFIAMSFAGIGLALWQGIRNYESHYREIKLMVGDESSPALVDVIVMPDRWIFVLSNESSSSAYVLSGDLDEVSPHPFDKPVTLRSMEIGAHSAPFLMTALPPPNGELCLFRALIRTRVGNYSEQMIVRQVPNGEWARALRIKNDSGKVVTHQEFTDYPTNSAGDVEWPPPFESR